MSRPVITGLGIVSPAGVGKEAFWEYLCNSKPLSWEKVSGVGKGAYVKGLDEANYLDSKSIKYLQPAEKLAIISSQIALRDAGIDESSLENLRSGVAVGSTSGCLRALAAFDQQVLCGEAAYADPSLVPSGIMNTLSGNVSIKNHLRGFHLPVSSGASSSLQAIHAVSTLMEEGRIDTAVVGGVEDVTPEHCQSFYLKHKFTGMIGDIELTEVGAFVVLESEQQATERTAGIYASCAGMGFAYSPGGLGEKVRYVKAGARAIHEACEDASISTEEIDFVCVGNNGAVIGNEMELSAIMQVLGNCRRPLPITSVRAVFGETLGASGALQVAASALAISRSIVLPALIYNFTDDEPELFADRCGQRSINHALITSFSTEGNMSCLVLKKH